MRTDESGQACPATLGEYRDMCAAIAGEGCDAVKFLDKKILDANGNRDEEVIAPDSQMRMLLMPMMLTGNPDWDSNTPEAMNEFLKYTSEERKG